MVKINFQNNVTKANADTFNTMQDNIEDAINKIGTMKQGFGDIFTSDGTYTATIIGNVVGTYIGNNIWKIDYSCRFARGNISANYYDWGISITKIKDLLNLDLEALTTSPNLLSNYNFIKTSGALDMSIEGYGTVFEYKSSINALLPARYYNTSASIGGWGLDMFENDGMFIGTIYLKEQ